MSQIRRRAAVREPVARVLVELSRSATDGVVKEANLTLEEGYSLSEVVLAFAKEHSIPLSNVDKLESALRARVVNPPGLQLLLGVIVPSADRSVICLTLYTLLQINYSLVTLYLYTHILHI